MARTPNTKSAGPKTKAMVRDATTVIQCNIKNPGRPPEYHEGFCHLVEVLFLVGGILNDAAKLLGTNVAAVEGWMRSYPDFSRSIKNARKNADAEVVKSLHHRARGYSHPAVKIFCTKDGDIVTANYTEHYPPDPTSGIFWLANRDPDNWRRGDPDAGAGVTAEEMKRALRAELQELDDANLTPEETAKQK